MTKAADGSDALSVLGREGLAVVLLDLMMPEMDGFEVLDAICQEVSWRNKDLSAVARAGDCLFLACDRTASVERLRRLEDGSFGDHRHFALDTLVALPAGAGNRAQPYDADLDDSGSYRFVGFGNSLADNGGAYIVVNG